MSQTISVRCKLVVPAEFRPEVDRTLQSFADACNQILEVARCKRVWNVTKLHHLTYHSVRAATGLKANHVCQALRRVVGNAKAVKQVHTFRPTSLSLDARTFSYCERDQRAGVTLLNGRVWFSLKIGGYQMALLRGQKPTSATLSAPDGHSAGLSADYWANGQMRPVSAPPVAG